jgi:hypothetical protein
VTGKIIFTSKKLKLNIKNSNYLKRRAPHEDGGTEYFMASEICTCRSPVNLQFLTFQYYISIYNSEL